MDTRLLFFKEAVKSKSQSPSLRGCPEQREQVLEPKNLEENSRRVVRV